MILLRWFGHACFRIRGRKTVVTDPFHGKDVGYPTPDTEADIVTVSHDHFDHNRTDVIKGDFVIVNQAGTYDFDGVKIKGVESYHDDAKGTKRGKNIIFRIEMNGISFCHLGDLGHVIGEDDVEKIGEVDVLLIPVGGHFTIGPEEAWKVIDLLNPKIVVPMHYKTEVLDFPIKPVDDFIRGRENVKIFDKSEVEVTHPEKMEICMVFFISPLR